MPQVEHSREFFQPHPVGIKNTEGVKPALFTVFVLVFLGILLSVYPSYASVTYRVRRGDTLDKIARRYKISIKKLKRENRLSSCRIKPGRKLRIAEAGRRHKRRKALRFEKKARHIQHAKYKYIHHEKKHGRRYVKRRRGHKVKIAREGFSVSRGEVAAVHDQAKGAKAVEEKKKESEKTASVDGAAAALSNTPDSALINTTSSAIFKSILEEAARDNRAAKSVFSSRSIRSNENRFHKVRKGETLFSIARRYGTTVRKLRKLNGMRSRRTLLKKGQRLLVSRRVAAGRDVPGDYRVKKGDTFLSIARKFHLDAEELMALNEMDPEDLRPGQTIMLKDEYESPAAQADARISAPQIESKIEELQDSKKLQSLSIKDRLMMFAKVMLNIPYRFGGNSFYGIDCSAFVQKVFNLLNIPLPRTARQQFQEGVPVSLDDLAIGDLVFFRTYASFPSHVGIYIGKNLFIHASSGGHRVKIGSLTTPYFMKRLIGAKRLLTGTAELPIPGSDK